MRDIVRPKTRENRRISLYHLRGFSQFGINMASLRVHGNDCRNSSVMPPGGLSMFCGFA